MMIKPKPLLGVRLIAVWYTLVSLLCIGSALYIVVDHVRTQFTQWSLISLLVVGVLVGSAAFWGAHTYGLWQQQKRSWKAFVLVHGAAVVGGIVMIVRNPLSNTISMQMVAVGFALLIVGYLLIPGTAKHFRC